MLVRVAARALFHFLFVRSGASLLRRGVAPRATEVSDVRVVSGPFNMWLIFNAPWSFSFSFSGESGGSHSFFKVQSRIFIQTGLQSSLSLTLLRLLASCCCGLVRRTACTRLACGCAIRQLRYIRLVNWKVESG